MHLILQIENISVRLLIPEGIMEGQMNFAAIISRLTCPHLRQAIDEFNETISLLFDKIK